MYRRIKKVNVEEKKCHSKTVVSRKSDRSLN
jgi:hypothetical protein